MAEPIFFRRADSLTEEQALYLKDLLLRTTKVGTEIELALPMGAKPEEFQPAIERLLQPSHSLAVLGEHGVLDVTKEHCGVEVRIIGRYPYYDALVSQYGRIIGLTLPLGVRARPTCGLHFHLIAVWSAQALPEIILANLWNQVRRYAPYLRFITAGGESRDALCRRRQHNSHLELVRHTPIALSMREIQEILKQSHVVPFHQNFLNLERVVFNESGQIDLLQVEFRFPDVDLAPTSIVAKTFLFFALLLRSVELSKYGLIHSGRIREWRRKVELLDLLSNNDGPLATSDTSRLTDDDWEEIRSGTRDMLDELRPAFSRFENPAFRTLKKLAETPVGWMRSAGMDWTAIEAELRRDAEADQALDSLDRKLIRIIELGEIKGISAEGRWRDVAADTLWILREELDARLKKLSRRRPQWDAESGAYLFVN